MGTCLLPQCRVYTSTWMQGFSASPQKSLYPITSELMGTDAPASSLPWLSSLPAQPPPETDAGRGRDGGMGEKGRGKGGLDNTAAPSPSVWKAGRGADHLGHSPHPDPPSPTDTIPQHLLTSLHVPCLPALCPQQDPHPTIWPSRTPAVELGLGVSWKNVFGNQAHPECRTHHSGLTRELAWGVCVCLCCVCLCVHVFVCLCVSVCTCVFVNSLSPGCKLSQGPSCQPIEPLFGTQTPSLPLQLGLSSTFTSSHFTNRDD